MRSQHPTDHLAALSPADAHHAAWAPLDPDVDFAWTEEVAGQLQAAANAMLSAAGMVMAPDNRGRALRAVAACRTAADRIEGCSGLRGEPLVRRASEALLAA